MTKRRTTLLFLAIVIVAAAWQPAAAADSYLKLVGGVGAGYYYLYPKDTQVQDFYRGGVTYRAFGGLKAESGLSVTGDIGYYSEGNRSSLAPDWTALTIIPISASVAYHFFKNSSLSPYLGAGVGFANISEKDPDFTYVTALKFTRHVCAGLDVYFDRNTLLRAELRQTFADPVSSTLYYQANFGGLTASLNVATEGPLLGGRKEAAYPEPLPPPPGGNFSQGEYNAIMGHLDHIDSYYHPLYWDRAIYQPWNTPAVYFNLIAPTPQQVEEQKELEKRKKIEQEQKRQDYLQQKLKLRQEKKGTADPAE